MNLGWRICLHTTFFLIFNKIALLLLYQEYIKGTHEHIYSKYPLRVWLYGINFILPFILNMYNFIVVFVGVTVAITPQMAFALPGWTGRLRISQIYYCSLWYTEFGLILTRNFYVCNIDALRRPLVANWHFNSLFQIFTFFITCGRGCWTLGMTSRKIISKNL